MKLKIGLIGLGHLGKIHLKCIREIEEIHFQGIYDVDIEIAKELSAQYQIPAYKSYETLLDDIDAIVIVTPTTTHFELAKRAIEKGKHCFIEKPVTSTLEEANALIALQEKYGVKVQVGHVERFNPAFLAASPYIKNPKFIEAHRLSMFKPRGTDVSVVHDLMIHDLDLISFIAKSELKEIRASGVAIVSPTADICNARIEYKNGLVANVTASRISLKTMRKIRIFQEDAYMSLDFQSKESEIFTLNETYQENSFELETYKGNRYISQIAIDTNSVNAILEEIKSFSKSIVTNTETEVNLKDGTRALELVDIILKQIER
ncbi:MAG: Gfo/Idh/MocA family oxidoreductase [Saprospiraceae bacterium]|nr:Gfo/Idh/MocA family oxidoreductase [Saprospiraceae bacterium]